MASSKYKFLEPPVHPDNETETRAPRPARLGFTGGLLAAVALLAIACQDSSKPGAAGGLPSNAVAATLAPVPPTMPVNEAVMVTVELDFGPKIPTIAEALQEIERRHQPEQGSERTFAILDAYGEPTPDGKKLHISMHVSSERPGVGSLIFKRTGEVLWSSRIAPSTNTAKGAFTGKDLKIFLDDGANKLLTVDGSAGPSSILEASIKELGAPLASVWPDGAEREMTFIYSACGCPVKVMVKRVGDRTMRAKELPVMFPDDPTVMTFIKQLMRW